MDDKIIDEIERLYMTEYDGEEDIQEFINWLRNQSIDI